MYGTPPPDETYDAYSCKNHPNTFANSCRHPLTCILPIRRRHRRLRVLVLNSHSERRQPRGTLRWKHHGPHDEQRQSTNNRNCTTMSAFSRIRRIGSLHLFHFPLIPRQRTLEYTPSFLFAKLHFPVTKCPEWQGWKLCLKYGLVLSIVVCPTLKGNNLGVRQEFFP